MAKRLSPKEQAVALTLGMKRLEEFRKEIDMVVPSVYSALAIALDENGWKYEEIEFLFARSQEIWTEHCENPGYMTDYCYEKTGIDVRNKEMY